MKVEAQGKEAIIRNSNGDIAIIPIKHVREVMDMIKDGCHGCIDRYVSQLPKADNYAQDGTIFDDPPKPNGMYDESYNQRYADFWGNQLRGDLTPMQAPNTLPVVEIKPGKEKYRNSTAERREDVQKVPITASNMNQYPQSVQKEFFNQQVADRPNYERIKNFALEASTGFGLVPIAGLPELISKGKHIGKAAIRLNEAGIRQSGRLVKGMIDDTFVNKKIVNDIKNRIKNIDLQETIDLKKSRMLARPVPNYDETAKFREDIISNKNKTYVENFKKDFSDMVDYGDDYWEKFKDAKDLEGMESKEYIMPTQKVYTQRIKYPKVKLLDELMDSYASPAKSSIGIGLNKFNEKEYKKEIAKFIKKNPHYTNEQIDAVANEIRSKFINEASPFEIGTAFNHELDHAVSYPTIEDWHKFEEIFDLKPDEMLTFKKIMPNEYYTGEVDEFGNMFKSNAEFGTELKARLGQIKDLLGKKGIEKTTMPELKAALKIMNNQEKYGIFNNMLDNSPYFPIKESVFRRIKDKKKLLDYMNAVTHDTRYTPHTLITGTIGGTALNEIVPKK